MNEFMIKWVAVKVTQEESIGQNNMRKRSIIVTEDAQAEYKKSLCVDFRWDKCDLLDDVKVWDTYMVYYNPKVRENNGRYYNSINGRRIQPEQVSGVSLMEEKTDMPF